MKIIKKVFGGLMLVGFMTMSFMNGNHAKNEGNLFSLKNLKALEASAGEMWCDPINETSCLISVVTEDGVFTGSSKGNPRGSGGPE